VLAASARRRQRLPFDLPQEDSNPAPKCAKVIVLAQEKIASVLKILTAAPPN
jgi:hypothetical protein